MTTRDSVGLVMYGVFLLGLYLSYIYYVDSMTTGVDERLAVFEARLEGMYQESLQEKKPKTKVDNAKNDS
jgi:hypothetical protein